MEDYLIYISVPKDKDIKSVVLPNRTAELIVNEHFYVKEGWIIALVSSDELTPDDMQNMWLKFDTSIMAFRKSEVDKYTEDPDYKPVALFTMSSTPQPTDLEGGISE